MSPESSARVAAARRSSPRDLELLDVTLDVLAESGYDRLTLDVVAARARASKATLYRRWPSKADLVVAAFAHAVGHAGGAPDTGTLRGDLLVVVEQVADEMHRLGDLVVALLQEMRRNPDLARAFEDGFLAPRRASIRSVYEQAARRGELPGGARPDLAWEVVVGLLLFRTVAPGAALDSDVHRELVGEILLPLAATAGSGSLASPR